MKIARVTGHVTAIVKDVSLTGRKMLVVNVENGAGKVLEHAVVVVDEFGAGPGDMVLIVTGSAARLPAGIGGIATDAAIVGIIDDINVA